mgnify:CR=1 FL=1
MKAAQRNAEGGGAAAQELARVKRLHDRNADALGFTAAKQGEAFGHRADAVFVVLFKVIGGVDAEIIISTAPVSRIRSATDGVWEENPMWRTIPCCLSSFR